MIGGLTLPRLQDLCRKYCGKRDCEWLKKGWACVYISGFWREAKEKREKEGMMGNEILDDRIFLDYPCPKCGGDVGHLINCPDGSCFSKIKGIQQNPMDVILEGLRPTMDDEHEAKKIKEWEEERDGGSKGISTEG